MNTLIKEIDQKHAASGRLWIWWIGQAGYVIKSQDLIIYIDPYLSDCAERITRGKANEHVRINPAPMQPADVNHADLVLCTHDHMDHVDPDAIPVIARESREAHFVVPEAARDLMQTFGIDAERIHTLRGDDSLVVKGVEVHSVPAKHEELDEDPLKGYPYLSYIIKLEGHTLLHCGDTIPYQGQVERVQRHTIDLAFVPINGRDEFRHGLGILGNFTCEEAVSFALAVKAGLTIPMHYDTFTLNTADVRDFCKIADRMGLLFAVMEHAGSLCFPGGETDGT